METDVRKNQVEELKLNNENQSQKKEEINQIQIQTCESEQEEPEEEFQPESETESQSESESESEYYQQSQQKQIVQIDEISDDELSEEEDDEFFYSSKQSEEQPSVDFELQLTLLQDALKKKSQVPQATIKEIIKTNSKKQKEQVKSENAQPKQKQSEKKEKSEKKQPEKEKNEKKEVEKKNQIIEEPQKIYKNEEIDIQLQQKETHVKSLKKALQLVDTFQEKKLEVVEKVQEEIKQQLNQPIIEQQKEEQIKEEIQVSFKGYSSPLIDDIPNFTDLKEEKVKDKKITQKLDGYMQKFSEDTYTQKIEKKKKEVANEEKHTKSEYSVNQDQQVQLVQLTGQNHPTKIVYEASEDSLKKFEEDFERRKQEKMIQIKQQLLPENKPSKAKFQSLAQDDQTLRAYKDFFYN